MSSADDFFRASTPSAKFPTVGTTVAGTIVSIGEARQAKDFATGAPKTWDDGSPIMQLPIELKTDQRDAAVNDDDGTRTLWVQAGSQMQKAIAAALRAANNAKLEVGGKLAITYVEDGTPKQRGFNPPKIYDAHYQAPTKAAAFFADPPAPATSAAVSVVPAPPAADPQAVAAALSQLSPQQRQALGI